MAIRKTFQIGQIDQSNRTVPVLASTPDPVPGADGKEALVTWDLARFEKNPVILWAHDDKQLPVGTACDIVQGPHGLSMTIKLASAEANPFAEFLWNSIVEKMVRAVSVGFDPGEVVETASEDGEKVTVRGANILHEVSFVPVPADEDAGTVALGQRAAGAPVATGVVDMPPGETAVVESGTDTDRKKKAASEAARALANHRHQKMDSVVHLDNGRLGRVERTSTGGARIPARIARCGVLEYRNPDGTTRRELRLPEEVFHPDSLASLAGVPVIDIVDHTGLVTPTTWRKVSLGHTESIHEDSNHWIAATLVVEDAETLDMIENGERTELSCGYVSRNEVNPGVWKGQPYDVIQRGIRYNHVALCPPNKGRSGPSVGLRLDESSTNGAWCATEINDMKVIKLDGKEYEYGSAQHLDKLEEMGKADLAKLTKSNDELQAKLDAKEADFKKADEEAADLKKKAADFIKEEKSKMRSAARAAVKLYRAFKRAVGKEEDDEDETKMDALLDECVDNPRAVMTRALATQSPEFKFDEKSEDYVVARFDAFVERRMGETGVDSIVKAGEHAKTELEKLDAKEKGEDVVAKAAKANHDDRHNAWKTINNPNGGQ